MDMDKLIFNGNLAYKYGDDIASIAYTFIRIAEDQINMKKFDLYRLENNSRKLDTLNNNNKTNTNFS